MSFIQPALNKIKYKNGKSPAQSKRRAVGNKKGKFKTAMAVLPCCAFATLHAFF
jgi:hypothetical protein